MTIATNTTILQKYHVLRLIGEGGNGRVWLAQEITFNNRPVAIKEPRTDLPTEDQLELQRIYRQEVQLTGALEQAGAPHLVRTFTVEPYEERPLLVMAYMPGGDLAHKLQEHAPLPVEQALVIAREVLATLRVVHEHPLGIVHRDVKPQNILFDAEGRAYLADFGLAQVGSTSGRSQLSARTHPGSPLYMAPEQANSRDYLTPAADIFAVGCVIFEMLTGKPYKRVRPGTPASTLRTDVPAWLDAVLAKALAEDPFDRYGDAAELTVALQAAPRDESTRTLQPALATVNTLHTEQAPASNDRLRWFGAGAALLALLTAGSIYTFGGNLVGGFFGGGALPTAAIAAPTATVELLPTATPAPLATATPAPTATATTQPTQTSRPSSPPPPTSTPTQPVAQAVAVVNSTINVRRGPGTNYGLIGSANPGERYVITGRDAAGAWWQIDYFGQSGWVFGQLVTLENAQDVPVAQEIPSPPTDTPTAPIRVPTATSAPVLPTPTPVFRPTATFAPTPTPVASAPLSETAIKATVAAAAGLASPTSQLQFVIATPTPP